MSYVNEGCHYFSLIESWKFHFVIKNIFVLVTHTADVRCVFVSPAKTVSVGVHFAGFTCVVLLLCQALPGLFVF